MGPDDDLKIIAEQTPCKLTPDLVCLLRCDFARSKGLDEVVAENAARLAEFLLGFPHDIKGGFSRLAVQSGYKADRVGFHKICRITDFLVQLCLFSVDGIFHSVIQPCTNGKNFRVRHITAAP